MKLFLRWQLPEFQDHRFSHIDDMDDGDIVGMLKYWLSSDGDLSLTNINLFHFVLGTVLVGIMSTFQLVYYLSYPTGGLFGRRGGRNNAGSWILIILVLIGIFKVMKKLYERVNTWSKKQMELVESALLDVNE